jgi:hypothetical protein
MSEKNNGFLKRADALIALANEQLNQDLTQGEISASFMYGSARFSAWMAATSFETSEDMKAEKAKIVEYFMQEYKLALEEHLDNHIQNFDFSQNNF